MARPTEQTATREVVVPTGGPALSATKAATRRRLLDAARELAAAGGYEAVTMRAVADRAGVSAPTAYQYFSSRDHVLVDVLIDLTTGATAVVAARPSRRRDPVERTVATLRRVVQRMEDEPVLFVALLRAYLSGAPEVAHAHVAMQSSMREWIVGALGDAEVPDRDTVVTLLESVLLRGLVGMVIDARPAVSLGDDLERAARYLIPSGEG